MHSCNSAVIQQVEGGSETQMQHQTDEQKEQAEITEEEEVKPGASDSTSDSLSERIRATCTDDGHSQSTSQQMGSNADYNPPPETHTGISLESMQSITHGECFQKHPESAPQCTSFIRQTLYILGSELIVCCFLHHCVLRIKQCLSSMASMF